MPIWKGVEYTNTGSVRSQNEDATLNRSNECLWAVADGMGGHEAGDYASQLVTSELSRYKSSKSRGVAINRIIDGLARCNTHLIEKAADEQAGVIGCTVAALSFHGFQMVCSWSGDSRIYRVRDKTLKQLTRDHCFQSLSDDRDLHSQPDALPGDGQMLTAAIGGESKLRIEHCWYTLDSDDRFLLCTDGLYKEVSDEELLNTIHTCATPYDIVDTLVTLYNQGGARDNVGLVYVCSNFP